MILAALLLLSSSAEPQLVRTLSILPPITTAGVDPASSLARRLQEVIDSLRPDGIETVPASPGRSRELASACPGQVSGACDLAQAQAAGADLWVVPRLAEGGGLELALLDGSEGRVLSRGSARAPDLASALPAMVAGLLAPFREGAAVADSAWDDAPPPVEAVPAPVRPAVSGRRPSQATSGRAPVGAAGGDGRFDTSLVEAPAAPRWRGRAPSPTRMVAIPAGCFQMGSPDTLGAADEHPRHEVCLSAFRVDRTPVTQAQYEHRVRRRPWDLCHGPLCATPGPEYPAWFVTWEEADAYCRVEGKRLPTEAEWEYLVRAGSGTAWPWGDSLWGACRAANLADLSLARERPGWTVLPCDDGFSGTAPVGTKPPNRFGVQDLAGNAWEWTSDWYAADWYARSPRQDPHGPEAGTGRVLRGGSWQSGPSAARSAYREGFDPRRRFVGGAGFRCVAPP